jgi:tetratricopeptide (TPR) repeat protein
MIVVMIGQGVPEDVEASRARLEEALEIYRDLGDTGGEGNAVWGLGSFYYFIADAATAEGWFTRALALHRAAGDRTMEAWSLHMLALSLIGQRRFEEGRASARHALRHFSEAGDIAGVTLVLDDEALVSTATGDLDRAGRLWGAARNLQATTGTALADYVQETSVLFGIETPDHLLPAEDLARLAAEGSALRFDELVAYALDEPLGSEPAEHDEAS